MARVFVSGGSGFIGGALCSELVAGGNDVVALARSDVAEEAVLALGAEPLRADALEEDRIAEGLKGCAIAYHVAGVNSHCPKDPEDMMRVNVGGAETAVRAAARAGVPRLVLTSSAASIGEAPGTIGHEDSPHRGWYLSLYDRSKHEGEQRAFDAARRLGVDVIAVNPSSVQGPGRASGNGKILIDYLNGKLPVFVDVYISVVDIADTVAGHLLAAEHGRAGARYVLNGATVQAREALEILTGITGVKRPVRMAPPALARGVAAVSEGAARARGKTSSMCRARMRTILHGHRYDGSRAARDLGLAYTPLAETFRRTVDWAREEGLVNGREP